MSNVRTDTEKSTGAPEPAPAAAPSASRGTTLSPETAFGAPRDFLDNRFVYVVISPRARGLSVGINMNPDKRCNFDCLYCEVQRNVPPRETHLDVRVMAAELQRTLDRVRSGQLRDRPLYRGLPPELLELKHVALSGDGEPTLCPNFAEAVEEVVHIRALREFFKLVLITNATELDRPEVQAGLRHFTRSDEIWAKLDGGTQAYLDKVSNVHVPLEKILHNILTLGRQRPIIIQSLFPSIRGEEPPEEEILAFAHRLRELKQAGAQIELVQIYSATRPSPKSDYGHLPLRSLSRIAQTVRVVAGLKAEVF
ncbi:radical SAM protein [Limisphaera sp. VF-2]|uniref:radical SAM protein n=1 Tax=Limisphaera sp. VF-2 TaxID=3400418 RepID=UPI001770743F